MGKTVFDTGGSKNTRWTHKNTEKNVCFFEKKIWKQCGNCWISFEETGLKLKKIEIFSESKIQKTICFSCNFEDEKEFDTDEDTKF